jgi:DNA-binding transcriptional ArsR family regulator
MLKYQPVDDVFRALGDPSRRELVERLSGGPATVSQLASPLDMSLSGVVQHLAVLESCGVVRSEKVGRTRTCRLEPVGLRLAEVGTPARQVGRGPRRRPRRRADITITLERSLR